MAQPLVTNRHWSIIYFHLEDSGISLGWGRVQRNWSGIQSVYRLPANWIRIYKQLWKIYQVHGSLSSLLCQRPRLHPATVFRQLSSWRRRGDISAVQWNKPACVQTFHWQFRNTLHQASWLWWHVRGTEYLQQLSVGEVSSDEIGHKSWGFCFCFWSHCCSFRHDFSPTWTGA